MGRSSHPERINTIPKSLNSHVQVFFFPFSQTSPSAKKNAAGMEVMGWRSDEARQSRPELTRQAPLLG